MKERPIRPLARDIQYRFFQAFQVLMNQGKIETLKSFTIKYELHEAKYVTLRRVFKNPARERQPGEKMYLLIDMDAPGYLVRDYGVSGDWMFTGKGPMFRKEVKNVMSVLF